MTPTAIQIVGAALFAVALVHTFTSHVFGRLAHRYPAHAGALHLLGEVEIVFGFWAMVLVAFLFAAAGSRAATEYVDSRNYTEPLFVFAIMVIAGSRPILYLAYASLQAVARLLPLPRALAGYFLALALVPLLGSFITEPAAMTLAALILRDALFRRPDVPERLKYATLAVLFVNVSIGGVLTPYAAPPVLMVAGAWGWDLSFMIETFGWKAALAVLVNAAAVSLLFGRRIVAARAGAGAGAGGAAEGPRAVPWPLVAACLALLAGVVVFAHHPAMFLGLLLLFMGVSAAYPQHFGRLLLREALLVAFFLAGLVVLGAQQQWWLQPLLQSMSAQAVFAGATALTAITDNAALTYLGSLVPGLSGEFKVALVAGAVTGGGLTVIANAPNPAGLSILRPHFADGSVSAARLFVAALAPTAVAAVALRLL